MRRILLSIIVLLFLAAIISFSFLYRMGEKAIEESILKLSELEESLNESIDEGKASEIGLNVTKAAAEADKPTSNNIKGNNATTITKNNDSKQNAAAPSNNARGDTSQDWGDKESQQAAESAKAIKNKVSVSEKTMVTKLLLSKLSSRDISELKGMLSNGITAEEKKKAIEILYSRLSTEDIKKIKDAYIKYTQQK